MDKPCNICDQKNGHLPHCTYEALHVILDCMSGDDGGVSFVLLQNFLAKCAKDGKDIPFLKQTANLISALRLR